jgi:hypothetical protein
MKTFEHIGFSNDRRSIVKLRVAKLSRFAIVLLILAAWFSISNHCALGALIAARTQSATAQMHCHGDQPSPSKKSSETEVPCCKLLRATVVKTDTTARYDASAFVLQQYFPHGLFFGGDVRHTSLPEEFDTGPPFSISFAESVLQRSIRAHAPPFSLS